MLLLSDSLSCVLNSVDCSCARIDTQLYWSLLPCGGGGGGGEGLYVIAVVRPYLYSRVGRDLYSRWGYVC